MVYIYTMRKIIFSHHYPKLAGQENAFLVSVDVARTADLDPAFLVYDTTYGPALPCCSGRYDLSADQYIILTLFGDRDVLFTTLRRYTEEKHSYYCENRLSWFKIIVEPVDHDRCTGCVFNAVCEKGLESV
jgi:hypothetical protein